MTVLLNKEISIHPLIFDAYKFCKALPRKCDIEVLPADAQKSIRSSVLIFLIEEENQYLVISGFENTNFNIENLKHYSIHKLKQMSDQKILEFCWCKVFLSFMSTIDNQKLGDVYELFKKYMPVQIRKKLTGNNILTQKFFSKLTKTANSTLSTQRAGRFIKQNKSNESLSILDEALINLGANYND